MCLSKVRAVSFSAILFCFVVSLTHAEPEKIKEVSFSDARRLEVAPPEEGNAITKALAVAGVKACLNTVEKVTNHVGYDGSPARVLVPELPLERQLHDKRMIPVTMELPLQGNAFVFVSSVFAPNALNGCSTAYEAVVYWPASCTEVYQKNYTQFKYAGVLSKQVSVLSLGPSGNLYLMPAGPGCVTIKQEAIN